MKKIFFIITLLLSLSIRAQRNPFQNLSEKNGKIGINTTNPDEQLTVKGKIHTQEVIVDLKGAVARDYIFENYFHGYSKLNPDYKLFSLEELEAFLKENQHLPDIPSAKEMEKNGILLKEMNLLLLQKIEELTLYTIQQQKEIDDLYKRIEKKN